jgi:hypothetical protein
MSSASASTVTTSARRAAGSANASIVVAFVAAVAMLVPVGPLAQFASIAGLLVLVGAVACARLDLASASLAQRVAICLGLGFLAFLVVGALLGAVLPHVGVARPLSRWPLAVAWCVIDAAIVVWLARSGRDPVRSILRGVRPRDAAWAGVLAVPPLLALVGVERLNANGGAGLADVVGVLAVVMALAAVALPTRSWCPPRILLLGSALVTGAWQGTFRGGWLAGFDIQHEFYIGTLAVNQGRFPLQHYVDPYGGMLSLTVWPASLHSLSEITLRTAFGLVPSIFLALALLATWGTLRDRLQPRLAAALCGLFVVGASPYVQQLPQITRQCYALFFLSLLVLAIASTRLAPSTARALAVASGVGLALTHYSSAYLAAGAVVVGCALTYLAKAPGASRVLTLRVSVVFVAVVALWGGIVARTGSSISQITSSIRNDGLQLLPGTGSVVSRWLSGAGVSQLVNASVIRNADAVLRRTRYHWMQVVPQAAHIPLVNSPAPVSHGVSVLGPLLLAAGDTVSQLVLLAAVVSALWLVWHSLRRDPAASGVAGIALFFVGVAGLSRFSQTVGVEFGPSRVEVLAYLVFVVATGVVLSAEPIAGRTSRQLRTVPRQQLAIAVGAVLVVVAVLTSTGLAALIERHQQLPAAYSSTGEQAQRLITPADVAAAKWVAIHGSIRLVVQADRIGALALDDFGFNDRNGFFATVDPIIVNNGSWIFAYRANVVLGTARGGNNAKTAVFEFPAAYFASDRPLLYTSATDRVYGPIPTVFARGTGHQGP